MVELHPGFGVLISKAVKRHAFNASTFSTMTTRLLRALFTENELSTCSVMGQSRKGVTKAALDPNRVTAIVGR